MSATLAVDEQREWERLRLHLEDPAIAELVELAAAPLDLSPDTRPIVVLARVVDEIRRQANNSPPTYEVGGGLLIRRSDNVVAEYVSIPNVADMPRVYLRARNLPPRWGHDVVYVHSHPHPSLRTPSEIDISNHRGTRLGIFHEFTASLGLFRSSLDGRSYTELTTSLVAAAPPDPSPLDAELEAALAADARHCAELRASARWFHGEKNVEITTQGAPKKSPLSGRLSTKTLIGAADEDNAAAVIPVPPPRRAGRLVSISVRRRQTRPHGATR